LGRSAIFQLSKSKYGVALSWDNKKVRVDLDLQAVVVDRAGTIVDAIYYNNDSALEKALVHTGDTVDGEAGGYDEMVWVFLEKLPKHIQLIIFVVAAYSGGHFKAAQKPMVNIIEGSQWHSVKQVALNQSGGDAQCFGVIKRFRDDSFGFIETTDVAEDGRHFMDILEPCIGDIIRQHIPKAPAQQVVSFPMQKGSMCDLPQAKVQRLWHVAIGWDLAQEESEDIDLDLSAICFAADGRQISAVYFDNPKDCGLAHGGDNVTGKGAGDDEAIIVDLLEVPDAVVQVIFVANIYTKAVTFDMLINAYCRVMDPSGKDLFRYSLSEKGQAGDKQGLIISRLYRNRFGRWAFQALGHVCGGRTWMDPVCISMLKKLSMKTPTDFQQIDHQAGVNVVTASVGLMKTQFAIRKGSCVDLGEHGQSQNISVQVGWDLTRGARSSVDLDVSTVFFDNQGCRMGAVFFDQKEAFGFKHWGDTYFKKKSNGTEEAASGVGDEVISVNLEAVPDEVEHCFFVVTVYTKGITFNVVKNFYCKVVEDSGKEILRYAMKEGVDRTGLILARLFRTADKNWGFEANGRFCDGRTWMDPGCSLEMTSCIFASELRRCSKVALEEFNAYEESAPACPPSNRRDKMIRRSVAL